ncbi:hypothetical protein L6164_010476 [Bauhinia variegata]|uniref:Uncharacterized protein n=1 Tax=Bauhinia variegata TaxID=167791 RepID=A0ACB9PN10_BAUVA|nr:hypothetical protein L6164_010476 [Bauhinia variegata]
MSSEDVERKKRVAVIGVSAFLLVAMVVAVTVGIVLEQNDSSGEDHPQDKANSHVSNSFKAVKSLCQPTDYKQECIDSLKDEVGNVTNPRDLIKIAFNITIKNIVEGVKKSQLLQDVEKEPRAKMALDSCKYLMEQSAAEFERSVEKIGEFDVTNIQDILMDLKVWLSGAITYQETCLDGFQNSTSDAGQQMKDALQLAMHLSSNGLAIIDSFCATLAKLNITPSQGGPRRLLQLEENVLGHGELPLWIGGGIRRRLLSDKVPGLGKRKADAVVAKDGSGDFNSVNEALKKVPKKNNKPFIIYIKEGVYNEYVTVQRSMSNVIFIGDGGEKTRITGNKNFIDGVNTFKTATVAVEGDYFMAVNIGFENSAGAEKHQAVALRVGADMTVFYKCTMDGYQDTLYAHTKRQFYRDCTISGTIDFVFGDALSIFQNCTFKVRKPMENQQCIVTAQGRKDRHEPTAIIIQGGSVVSDPSFYPFRFSNKAYLARPWKLYSRTIIMDAFIDDSITPEGYLPWQVNLTSVGTNSCFYSEFNNRGPGSDKSKRVRWPGIKTISAEHALDFTPFRFYKGDAWIKKTGVPYSPSIFSTKSDSDGKRNSDDSN